MHNISGSRKNKRNNSKQKVKDLYPWKRCSSQKKTGPICSLNNTQFIVHNGIDCSFLKYDATQNKWTKFIDMRKFYKQNYLLKFREYCPQIINGTSINVDQKNEIIYIYVGWDSAVIMITDLRKNKQIYYHQTNAFYPPKGKDLCSVFIDNKLHIISYSPYNGNQRYNKHFIYDVTTNQMKTNHIFVGNNMDSGIKHAGMVPVKSQNKLFWFGGITIGKRINILLDDIWCFSLKNKKWKLLSTKLPQKMLRFGFVLTADERYIILFGGWTNINHRYYRPMDDIWILDITQNPIQITKSLIKCPIKGSFHAVGLKKVPFNNKLIYGYIREYCPQIIYNDVIQLIISWSSSEFVHLICYKDSYCQLNGDHFRIEIQKLFN